MKKLALDAKDLLVSKTGAGNDFLGWIDLPVDYDKEEFDRIKKAAAKIQSDSEVLLVIGIGGSYLGARAAIEFLRHSFYNTVSKEIRKTPYYRLTDALDVVRGTFMLQNIEAALNQYDVVFIEMGSGHYVDMYRALQKMLGKPHYIAADQIPPQNLWQECSLEGLQEKVLVQ